MRLCEICGGSLLSGTAHSHTSSSSGRVVALNVEAGWLAEHDRRVAEKAWDEGHELGVADESFAGRGLSSDPDAAEHPHDNPYSPQ